MYYICQIFKKIGYVTIYIIIFRPATLKFPLTRRAHQEIWALTRRYGLSPGDMGSHQEIWVSPGDLLKWPSLS